MTEMVRPRAGWTAATAAAMALLCAGASAQTPISPAAHEAAAELSAAKGDTAMVTTLISTMRNQIIKVISDKGHVPADHATTIFDDILMPELRAHAGELAAALVDIYAQNFSIDELHQLTAFFRTPLGMKYLSKTPLIFQEAREAGREWGRRIAADAFKKHAQELRDKGITL